MRSVKTTQPSIVELATRDIIVDPKYQLRPVNKGTVRQYIWAYSGGADMPPVKVASLNGALILFDGWHRMAALAELGWYKVRATIEHVSSNEWLRWLAAKANTTHGRPLEGKEIREAFRRCIKAKRYLKPDGTLRSYRELAQEMDGIKPHTTLRRWLEADFPKVFALMAGEDKKDRKTREPAEPDAEVAELVFEGLRKAINALPGVNSDRNLELVDSLIDELQREWQWKDWSPTDRGPAGF